MQVNEELGSLSAKYFTVVEKILPTLLTSDKIRDNVQSKLHCFKMLLLSVCNKPY